MAGVFWGMGGGEKRGERTREKGGQEWEGTLSPYLAPLFFNFSRFSPSSSPFPTKTPATQAS